MTKQRRDFEMNRPGAVIAALPAVLGFVPEKSLVLLSIDDGELGSVMRIDLSDAVGLSSASRKIESRRGLSLFMSLPQVAAINQCEFCRRNASLWYSKFQNREEYVDCL